MQENLISHNVFFELKNDSEEAVSKFISDCYKYLNPIEGIIYFIAGRMHEEHDRDVNVMDYHVATHVTFISQEAHDKYQNHPLHNEFLKRNKDNWKSVRVFDWLPDHNS